MSLSLESTLRSPPERDGLLLHANSQPQSKTPGPEGPGAVPCMSCALLPSVIGAQARRVRHAARIVARRLRMRRLMRVVATMASAHGRIGAMRNHKPCGNRLE